MAEDKQHQALYRRYRPQTPAEVLGQDHVVRALTGAIRENRLHHAFLFCGPRGTGKTSTARILAKMVNCENGPTAEPCGTCTQCVAVREGQHLDVVEIDAASHGGVEDARELRERAPTAPAMGREKVYIIDEAQRLSREAFDALLKVFEEPPPGVRFVLATTEPHKMPATIIGRCQRFDFRRITMEQLAAHLQTIAAAEGVTLTGSAAAVIARHSEGSARDALSLLDQASVMGGQTVDDEVIAALLGAPRAEVQHELADAVAVGDARAAFEIVNRLVQDGQDLRNVTAETLAHFRNLLLVQTAPGQDDLLDVAADRYEHLRAQAAKFTAPELARVIELLLAAQNDMRWTTSPRLSLELALVRGTLPETDPNPAGLVARMERLERLANLDVQSAPTQPKPAAPTKPPSPADDHTPVETAAEPPFPQEAVVVPAERGSAARASDPQQLPTEAEPARADVSPDAGAATATPPDRPGSTQESSAQEPTTGNVDTAMLRRSWPSLIDHLGQHRKMILRALLESATVADFDGETLELAFPPDKKFGVQKVESQSDDLRSALGELFGIKPRIVCIVRDPVVGGGVEVLVVEEEETPSEEEALRRLREQLGATVPSDMKAD
ncbi:MAG: DNA polymerase III subunit gamma/tau [Actinobacteria bacterium]|nr:DNA polymerase III subunit gamma/tau [Actinomycetota bacterium]